MAWGVDSSLAANSSVGSQTLFDYITQQAGQAPAFWGRYIGGNYALSLDEANFIHGEQATILVVYNGATAASVSGDYQSGANDANNAITAAYTLGISNALSGVVIYADVESSWSPTPGWIQGWADTFANSPFYQGMYANTDNQTNGFDGSFCTAVNNDSIPSGGSGSVEAMFLYASEPEPGCTNAGGAPPYAPDTPSCVPTSVYVWQYAENCYSGLVDEDEDNSSGAYGMW